MARGRAAAAVPALRVRALNRQPVRPERDFVCYWSTAARRAGWNFALEHAAGAAAELRKPLVVLEALRCGYRWASERFHAFVLEGMADSARRHRGGRVLYYPYVESRAGAGRGLLEALGSRACLVVGDDYPAFFLPRMLAAAGAKLDVRLDAVDSNGLLPVRAAGRAHATAYSFRRFLQSAVREHLEALPADDPLAGARLPRLSGLPDAILRRWPPASAALLRADPEALAALPIDHAVPPAPARGGAVVGEAALREFLARRLERYLEERNQPEREATSGLSPYLHFGQISAHQVFHELAAREGWSPHALAARGRGSREGFWGMSRAAEAFLDQLVTWRELGFNFAAFRADLESYDSLPAWARATLAAHEADPRVPLYGREQLERAQTHDPLWNAAQTQLLREGRIHNYLRMLWGKKILEWSPSPRAALEIMIELNNRWALDGRDPNSYSGIFWILGRYDRPWGPERRVFGTVRYMSSENTARKFGVRGYLRRHAPDGEPAEG